MRRLVLFLFLILALTATGNAQASFKLFSRNPEKKLFRKSAASNKDIRVNEPRSVLKAKKKQEKNEKKLKKEYAKSVEASRKRAYDIQTPEVQSRMKQDKKNSDLRDKEKKKKRRSTNRKAGKKYN